MFIRLFFIPIENCLFFQRVLTFNPSLVNCRDAQGRNSTPLHFAAGYNRLQVVEYLLSLGADVTAKDKGYSIIPLDRKKIIFSFSFRWSGSFTQQVKEEEMIILFFIQYICLAAVMVILK